MITFNPCLASYCQVCTLEVVFKNVAFGDSLAECSLLLLFLWKIGDEHTTGCQ